MTWIETNDGFAVARRRDDSVIYICLHEDCSKVAWGTSELSKLFEHLQLHKQGIWEKKNE